jgi:hypothetical protein
MTRTSTVLARGAFMNHARLATVAAAAVMGLVALAPAAHASALTPFTITEDVDFAGGNNTFTATGELCPSGTFSDDVHTFTSGGAEGVSGGANGLIRTVFTCDDGSGSFYAQKHVFLTFNDDGFTNTGPIALLGGTGRYAGLSGHGVDDGVAVGDHGVGHISGVLMLP